MIAVVTRKINTKLVTLLSPYPQNVTETQWFTAMLISLAAISVCGPALLASSGFGVAAVLAVAVVFCTWTCIGRRFYRDGFYLFFDFLSFMSFIAGFIVICTVVYRWITA